MVQFFFIYIAKTLIYIYQITQRHCSIRRQRTKGHENLITFQSSKRSAWVVIQRVATRRSKQTGQHKQHLTNTNPATKHAGVHWHGPANRVGQRVQSSCERPTWTTHVWSVRRIQVAEVSLDWWNRCRVCTFCSFPSFLLLPYLPLSSFQVWLMPYSLSLNLHGASWMCCHRNKKKKRKLAGCLLESLNFV